MKNLLLISLFFIFCSSTCDEKPEYGFTGEPLIHINFEDGNQQFQTLSQSINHPKKKVKRHSSPGIDMNANETKYWIIRNMKTDSFTLRYKLKTYYIDEEHLIGFDSIRIIESSFSKSKIIFEPNEPDSSSYYRSHWYIPSFHISE